MRVAFVNMSAVDLGRADTSDRRYGSDEIGFGVTSAAVLREALGRFVDLVDLKAPPSTEADSAAARLEWIYRQYDQVRRTVRDVDAVLVFHVANTFGGEIKRMLLDLGLRIPLVGYTHGSHWDPTDLYRFENYDGLQYVDLGNLLALDRVLLVSNAIRAAILTSVAGLNRRLADELARKCRVVGLPVDLEGIEAARSRATLHDAPPRVLFNHSFTTAKQPKLFLDACEQWLSRFPDLHVDITRRPSPEHEADVRSLRSRHPGRVHVWNDLPTRRYQELLTTASVHVSCATHETFGVSTVEAVYAGACSVVPAVGVYPELMRGIDGAVYDGTAGELERRVTDLLHDEDRRRTIAAMQRQRAAQFSGDRIASAVAGVLTEAVGTPG